MRVAVTGATGSLGGALIAEFKKFNPGSLTGVVSLSRDEVKAAELGEHHADWPPLKCMLGDVRDERRLEEVFRGCQAVIHAAALKRVDETAYSPEELVKTNVQGTINVIRAAAEVGVRKVVVVSSDKAVEATNAYGMSKAMAESYAVQSNAYTVPRGTRVSCVRYGNVLGSRGSVVHVWRRALREGRPLRLTDLGMTRFIITLPQAAQFVLGALDAMEGGEIFVPVLPAATLGTLVEAVEREFYEGTVAERSLADGRFRHVREVVGLRPGGEKLHESLLSREEPSRAYQHVLGCAVRPSHHSWRREWAGGYPFDRAYSSDRPDRWLTEVELVEMLRGVA